MDFDEDDDFADDDFFAAVDQLVAQHQGKVCANGALASRRTLAENVAPS
jgi:hypothetical protein